MKNAINNALLRCCAFAMAIFITSCADFLEVKAPLAKISSGLVFEDDATATSAMVGVYIDLYTSPSFASGEGQSLSVTAGLSADELINNSTPADPNAIEFQTNALNSSNSTVLSIWASAYRSIYAVNSIIEGVSSSSGMSVDKKRQLTGEALFVRAFCYFYLTNIFGDIPLITSTNYQVNSSSVRDPIENVLHQIKSDLLGAEELLSDEYVQGERTRPNRSSASALLSRVYAYTRDWARAEDRASRVLQNVGEYGLQPNLDHVFLANNREAIWQLSPVDGVSYTTEAYYFNVNNALNFNVLDSAVLTTLESNDKRATSWITTVRVGGSNIYLPSKYKKIQLGSPPTEYSTVLRLAEIYLIRAEARAQQNKLSEAIMDIDKIRERAGLEPLRVRNPGIDKIALLQAIENERRIELLTEWGHRWLDLKRFSRGDEVLGARKAGWTTNDYLYPIPESEISKNRHLAPQNLGY